MICFVSTKRSCDLESIDMLLEGGLRNSVYKDTKADLLLTLVVPSSLHSRSLPDKYAKRLTD